MEDSDRQEGIMEKDGRSAGKRVEQRLKKGF